MPTKTTKKTSVKKESSTSKKVVNSSKVEKKDSAKKVVVKRRKLDLAPTRASAVAIASQANRAKKQALINKVAAGEKVIRKSESSTKIPLWVWVFFGCSLLLFCVSFYQAIIRPQLEEELTQANVDENVYVADWEWWSVSLWWDISIIGGQGQIEGWDDDLNEVVVPKTAVEVIQAFFDRLSNNQIDEAYDLMNPVMQRSSEIKEHFTAFRMSPFIAWLQWNLKPTNLKYISTSTYWKDKYGFDLSYTLASSQQTFDESREFMIDTSWEEPKIASIVCITPRCSYHPIFWPENYGLMR